MKKLVILLILTALALPLFAQNQSNNQDTPLYCFNVSVERIFLAKEGYLVQYRKNNTLMGVIGIPYNWFTDAGGKADVVRLPAGTNWPSISLFYSDGEFDHLRLYIHREKSHVTWGVVQMGLDVSRYFPDGDSFKFEF